MAKKPKACRHCERRAAWASRGLCQQCYNSPARELYPLGKNAKYTTKRKIEPWMGKLPAVPTDALPGTPEKVEVMARRVARGESCFHPDDILSKTEDD